MNSSKEVSTSGESTFLGGMQPGEERSLERREREFAGVGRNRLLEELRANALTCKRFALSLDGAN
jgi:hypothetical protein